MAIAHLLWVNPMSVCECFYVNARSVLTLYQVNAYMCGRDGFELTLFKLTLVALQREHHEALSVDV